MIWTPVRSVKTKKCARVSKSPVLRFFKAFRLLIFEESESFILKLSFASYILLPLQIWKLIQNQKHQTRLNSSSKANKQLRELKKFWDTKKKVGPPSLFLAIAFCSQNFETRNGGPNPKWNHGCVPSTPGALKPRTTKRRTEESVAWTSEKTRRLKTLREPKRQT